MKRISEGPGSESVSRKSTGIDRFLSAFSLASRIPVRAAFSFDPSRLDFHLPLVGLPVALLASVTLAAVLLATGSPVAAGLAVLAVQYLAFNLFHLDGLMDTADAFLGPGDAQRRLAILKDSRIGAFAFFAGFMLLASKLALLHRCGELGMQSGNFSALAAVLAYPVAGRSAAALVPVLVPPARDDGLGSLAKGSKASRVIAGSVLSLLLWAGLSFLLPAMLASVSSAPGHVKEFDPLTLLGWACVFPASLLPAQFLARTYKRGVGGYTGDALGSAVELGELSHLALSLSVLGAAGALL